MANYDLGTAHGRIVIDNDSRGASDAARSLAQLEQSAKSLEKAFAGTQATMERFTQNIESSGARSSSSEQHVRRLGSTVGNVGGIMAAAANQAQAYGQALENMGRQAFNAGQRLDGLQGNIERFTSVSGAIRGVVGAFGDMDSRMARLPAWQRNVVGLNSAFTGLAFGAANIRRAGIAAGALITSSSAFGIIAPRVSAFGNTMRATIATLGLAFPRFNSFGNAVRDAGTRAGLAGRDLDLFGRGVIQATRGITGMITGGLLVGRALEGVGRALRLVGIGIGGLSLAAGAMQILGTTVLGLANAIGQLSGAALILPGVFLTLGTAVGFAKIAFGGFKDVFKALGKDGADFDKAIAGLPPTMQQAARSLNEFKGQAKNFREILQSQALLGFSKDIKALGDQYFPILNTAAKNVGNGLNSFKNGLRDFLVQPATVRDLNNSFNLTAQTLHNLGPAITPFLDGLRNIAIVGQEAFRDISGGAQGAAQKFADFTQQARDTGKLRAFIDNAIQGFKDLGASLKTIGSITKTVFEAFGASGQNSLARMRQSLENFNATVKDSAKGGGLQVVADSLKRMASVSFATLSAAFHEIIAVIQILAPLAAELSNSFSGSLLIVIQGLGAAFRVLASALASMPALGSFVGSLLAMGVALKGMALLFSPIVRGFQLIAGAVIFIRGAILAIGGLSTAMSTAAGRSALLSAAMGKLTAATAATAAASTLTAALIAGISVYLVAKSGMDNLSKGYSDMASNAQLSERAVVGFNAAFRESNGVMDKGVFNEGVTQMDNLRKSIDSVANDAPGWKESFADLRLSLDWKGLGTFHTEQFQNLQKASDDAKAAASAMDKLKLTSKDLSTAVTGSDSAWQGLHDRLAALGPDGVKAIDALYGTRLAFTDTKAAMDRVGPGGVQLTNALKTMGDAGANTADRLGALKSALQGLGLIQTTATQAAFDYQEALRQMGDTAGTVADANLELGNGLLTANGQLDATKQNAFNLNQALQGMADKFLDAASKGGNIGQMWNDLQGPLQALADAFHLPLPALQELITKMGVVPRTLEIVMSLKGADDVKQEVTGALLRAQSAAGTPITVTVNSQQAIDALTGLGAKVTVFDDKQHVATFTIDPAAAVAALDVIKTTAGQPLPAPLVGVPQTPNPAPPKGQPGVTDTIPPAPVGVPQTPPPAPPPPTPGVTIPAPKVETPQTPTPAPPPPAAPIPAPKVETPVVPPIPPIPPPPPVVVTITGVDAVIGGINQINGALADSQAKWDGYSKAIGGAMQSAAGAVQSAVSNITGILASASSGAFSSGAAIGQGFADGIESKVGAVRQAALDLAEAAAAPLPRSPAKIGPFSGTGWTPFRGAAMAQGFAQGIVTNTPLVLNASLDMVTLISNAMDSVRAALGQTVTSFGANRAPGASGSKFFRDPEITDQQLQANRDKKAADQAKTAADNARFKASDDAKAAADASKSGDGSGGTGKTASEKSVDTFVRSLDKAQYGMGQFNNSMLDCSAFVSAVANEATGRAPFSERASTANMAEFLKARGFKEGTGGAGDLRVGWFNDPSAPGGGHAALTTGTGLNAESTTGGVRFGKGSAGSNDPQFNQHMFLPMSKAIDNNTASVDQGTKATVKSSSDINQSQQEIVDTIVATGLNQGATQQEIDAAVAAGLVESNLQNLPGGPGSSVGVFQQQNFAPWTSNGRDRMNVRDAATTFFEQIKQTSPDLSPGDRAQAVQKSAFPAKYAQQLSKAQSLTAESMQRQGKDINSLNATSDSTSASSSATAANTDIMAKAIETGDPSVDAAVKLLQSGNANDAQVIQSLQTIDDTIATTPDRQTHDDLEALKTAVMEDRGIKQFDPNAGASKDPVADTIKVVQAVVGLFDTLEQGLNQLVAVGNLLARGISSTEDVNTLIDGVQSIASTIGQVISTVSEIVSTVASIAAIAGFAIPGIGQVAAVASLITGGIGQVNAVIDLAQQIFKIAGRFLGTALSFLAGGKDGPLMGDVKILLDTNDNTIKTWSSDNPDDKRVTHFGASTNGGNTTTQGIGQMNIYAGPGASADEIMSSAMYAVRAGSVGAGAYG